MQARYSKCQRRVEGWGHHITFSPAICHVKKEESTSFAKWIYDFVYRTKMRPLTTSLSQIFFFRFHFCFVVIEIARLLLPRKDDLRDGGAPKVLCARKRRRRNNKKRNTPSTPHISCVQHQLNAWRSQVCASSSPEKIGKGRFSNDFTEATLKKQKQKPGTEKHK